MCNCDLFVSSLFLPFVLSFLLSCPFLHSSVKRWLLLFLKGHIFINLVTLFEGNKECHLLCGCNLLKSKVCIRRQDLQLLHKTVSKELHIL